MKIDIIERKNNPLLSREEVKGILVFDKATPSNDELQSILAKQLSVEQERIRIKKIATKRGISKANFLVFVYSSRDVLEHTEPAPKKWLEKQQKKAEAKKKSAGEAEPAAAHVVEKKEGAE